MRTALAICAAMVLLAGCGSSKHVSTQTSSISIPSGTTTVSTPVVAPTAQLKAVRDTTENGLEKVEFEFDGGVPGYSVGYVNRPVQEDGSGKDVPVQGDNVLEMHMEHASGVNLAGGQVTHTYTGPKRMSPGGPAVAELVQAGDFEGVLRWVAGTHGKPAFAVTTLTNPSRVVVDIAAP